MAITFAATSTMWTHTWNVTLQVAGTGAVTYNIITDLPGTMNLDTEYPLVIQCKNTAAIPYEVKAYLKCVGPNGFNGNDIFLRWRTYNETAGSWVEFAPGITEFYILGRVPSGYSGGGVQGGAPFANHDGYWIDWDGTYSGIAPHVVLTHYLYVTIYGSAPTGGYSLSVTVTGQGV